MERQTDPSDRPREPNPQLTAASLEASRQNTEKVQSAIARLQTTPRVPDEDRPLLAISLGRWGLDRLGDNPRRWMTSVFEEAFGKEWEAHYKKRKRFLRFPGEDGADTGAGAYNAHGAHFVRLAHAIADHAVRHDAPKEDLRRQAEARLIEGSSFDSQSHRFARQQADISQRFADHMQKLADKVLAEVDLHRYRELARTHQFYAFGNWPKQGTLRAVSGEGCSSQLDLQYLPLNNLPYSILPRIELGHVWVQRTAFDPFAEIDVSKADIALHGESKAVARAIGSALKLRREEGSADGPDGLPLEYDFEDWDTFIHHLFPRLPGFTRDRAITGSDGKEYVLWIRYTVFLDMRYDTDTGQWRLCLGQHLNERPSGDPQLCIADPFEGDLTPTSADMLHCIPFRQICDEGSDNTAKYVVSNCERELWDTLEENYIFGNDTTDIVPPVAGLQLGALPLPLAAAVDYALSPIGTTTAFWHASIEAADQNVPELPLNSIGRAIMSNLAYATEEARLNQLLIADAKAKLQALEAFHAQEMQSFSARLKWLDQPE